MKKISVFFKFKAIYLSLGILAIIVYFAQTFFNSPHALFLQSRIQMKQQLDAIHQDAKYLNKEQSITELQNTTLPITTFHNKIDDFKLVVRVLAQLTTAHHYPVTDQQVNFKINGVQGVSARTSSEGILKNEIVLDFKQKTEFFIQLQPYISFQLNQKFSILIPFQFHILNTMDLDFGTLMIDNGQKINIEVKGCIVNINQTAVAGSNVTIEYKLPLLLDIQSVISDKNGCFIFTDQLTYFDVILARIIVTDQNYFRYDSDLDPSYQKSQGIILSDNFHYQLEDPIILQEAIANLVFYGIATNQYKQPEEQVQVIIKLWSLDNEVQVTADPVLSKKDGSFYIQIETKWRTDYNSQLIASKDGFATTVEMNQIQMKDKEFQKEINIKITPQHFYGMISGIIQDEQQYPIAGAMAELNLVIKPTNKALNIQTVSQSDGVFLLKFEAFKGESYSGNITFSKPLYLNKNNDINRYTIDNMEVQLQQK